MSLSAACCDAVRAARCRLRAGVYRRDNNSVNRYGQGYGQRHTSSNRPAEKSTPRKNAEEKPSASAMGPASVEAALFPSTSSVANTVK